MVDWEVLLVVECVEILKYGCVDLCDGMFCIYWFCYVGSDYVDFINVGYCEIYVGGGDFCLK